MSRSVSHDVVFSVSAFALSLIISFYSYGYLWRAADKELFAIWMAVFELSQFLLLLDFGFTNAFIRKNSGKELSSFLVDIPRLRGSLLLVSVIASLILALSAVQTAGDKLGFYPFVFLAISIGFTLIGYADTAALRVLRQFKKIYIINIFSNLIFFLVLHLEFIGEPVDRLAIATLFRSVVSYFLQSVALGVGIHIGVPGKIQDGLEVVALNTSYFLYFMLDGVIMASLGVPLLVIASSLAIKKYFDAMRGIWDAALGVLSIDFAEMIDRNRDWIIRFLVVASFLFAWVFSSAVIGVWLGSGLIEWKLSVGLCISGMFLSIYRIDTMRMYFQGGSGFIVPIAAALLVKSIFSSLLAFSSLSVGDVYLVQGLLIGIVTLIMHICYDVLRSAKLKKGDFDE